MSWPIKELANQAMRLMTFGWDQPAHPYRSYFFQVLAKTSGKRGLVIATKPGIPPGSDCTDEADIQLTVEHMLSGMPVSAQGALDREISFSDGKPFVGHNCSRNTSQRPQF
jgi:hypothetical protein